MAWPTAIDYFDAVQHPLRRFCKPDLKRSQVALDADGKPQVRSGTTLDIYEMRGAGGHDRWAIGFYTRQPRGLARRFMLINEHLQHHPAASLVHTDYSEQGICIRGRWHPLTHSRWVDGVPLNAYVREYLDHPEELRALGDVWVRLAKELSAAGVAHGNLGPDTVLVAPAKGGSLAVRVVDYDTFFVPALADSAPAVMGHVDFQHPRRDWQTDYNAEADRFSQLVVLTSLVALAVEGGALWERFNNGTNLLFRHADFQEPTTSALFRELWQSESNTVRALTGQLILACDRPVCEVPALEQVAECLRPGAARNALSMTQIDQINNIMEIVAGASEKGVNFGGSARFEVVDDLVLELDDNTPQSQVAVAVAEQEAIVAGEPPGNAPEPPPLPAEAHAHPLTATYEFDAWMPEEIAVVKVRGFVKDVGGELIRSIPGYIRVNLLDTREPAASSPGLMAWLGLSEQPPPLPRVVAVMELNMVNKPTPQRKLIGITVRLTPGPEDDVGHDWKKYCDRAYCELRGYMMGFN
ncbi:MAG TPA: hypothetical protein VE988_06170 [Gemmataceae bacterium]|nr:hypothetical protein [Gemmataceae bacterium]